jgi:hypothetical protein
MGVAETDLDKREKEIMPGKNAVQRLLCGAIGGGMAIGVTVAGDSQDPG